MRWLVARREAALEVVVADLRPVVCQTDENGYLREAILPSSLTVRKHRSSLRFWDAVLDLVTLRGRL